LQDPTPRIFFRGGVAVVLGMPRHRSRLDALSTVSSGVADGFGAAVDEPSGTGPPFAAPVLISAVEIDAARA
jgi:hypothetical protein